MKYLCINCIFWEQISPSLAESSGRLSFVQPLRHAYGVPPLLVGEALAGRATFYWKLKAQYNAKKSALLPRLAAA